MQPNQPFQSQYPLPPGGLLPNPGVAPQLPKKQRPWGWIITLSLLAVFLLAALGFGIWAFSSRQDFKTNSDKKAAAAVAIAVQQESTRKDKEFVEQEKSPFKKYLGPVTFGGLDISYPKTWSAFINETNQGPTPVDGYLHPNYVPGLQSGTAFALRIEVVGQNYEQVLRQFESKARTGKLKIVAYSPKNVPEVVGSRIDGEINSGQQDSMVVLPLRDKTIKISTQSQQFIGDFNNIILENLKFTP